MCYSRKFNNVGNSGRHRTEAANPPGEDNPVNAKLAMRLLEKRGHEVRHVTSGHKALEILEMDSFDVVFMGVQMPEMDGLEATRRVPSGSSSPASACRSSR